MKNKTVIIWTTVAVVLLGLLWLGGRNQASGPNQSETTKSSVLTAQETFFDFGTISMAKGNVSRKFKVTNNTGKDIFLSSLTTSCMCTSAYYYKADGTKKGPYGMPSMGFVPKLNETIKAGESHDVEIVYNPAAHGPAGVGPIDRFVYLEDSTGGVLKFEIKAVVTP